MVLRTEICTASWLFIYPIVRADISDTCAELEVPSLADHPLVTVTDTGTVVPAFMSCASAVSEQIERSAYIAYIEFTSVNMETKEMSVELFAEPVPGFRLRSLLKSQAL